MSNKETKSKTIDERISFHEEARENAYAVMLRHEGAAAELKDLRNEVLELTKNDNPTKSIKKV